MDCPCRHCDKANIDRPSVLKCDKPCTRGRRWYLCEQNLLDILTGKPLDEVMKGDNAT